MSNEQRKITQTIAKAALKTFAQSFLAILVLLLVPELSRWAADVGNGGTVDVNAGFFAQVGIAALGGGIAAVISYLQNRIGTIPS